MVKLGLKTSMFVVFFFYFYGMCFGETIKPNTLKHSINAYHFSWDVNEDKAKTTFTKDQTIWEGSLLPAFWLLDANDTKKYVKAKCISVEEIDQKTTKLLLNFADLGSGSMLVNKEDWGISVKNLYVEWADKIPLIIDMYFGTSVIPAGRQSLMDNNNSTFSSDWSSFGFCVPGAKEGTVQSYFRMWDFGQTNISLGSFAPSMGTPYGAAFPRPVLAMAMGNNDGMMVFGTGNIPDAPMTLKIRSSLGCINFLYREDLWGAGSKKRNWENPLRITFGKNAWLAFRRYFNTFPEKETLSVIHQKAVWNTWGDWRNKKYPIRPITDFAKKVGAEIVVTDDPWEESQGLGKPNLTLFPNIYDDLKYIYKNNMSHGIWETLGWIGDTLACGLSSADLICDINGNPCIGSWNFNPFASGYFCIDISSDRACEFLQERTISSMKLMKPSLIKLDFGYGMPNPNIGVPKDPQIRGERYTFELFKLIVEAAKSVNPDVTIMYYGISPLFHPLSDMVSLDDQGDMWYETKQGHGQWTIWASLLSDKQVALSGSSSYDWFTDDHIILNSFILGSPGSVLGTQLDDGSNVPEKYLNRRLAINKWYRKTIQWEPLWLNSQLGDFNNPPIIKCVARTELSDGKKQITVLVLNGEKDNSINELKAFEWKGRWAIVSQTEDGILETNRLAVIPFDVGYLKIKLPAKPFLISVLNIEGTKVYNDWDWQNGVLALNINKSDLAKTAGFVIQF